MESLSGIALLNCFHNLFMVKCVNLTGVDTDRDMTVVNSYVPPCQQHLRN